MGLQYMVGFMHGVCFDLDAPVCWYLDGHHEHLKLSYAELRHVTTLLSVDDLGWQQFSRVCFSGKDLCQ